MLKDNLISQSLRSIPFGWTVLGILAFEVLSFVVFQYPAAQIPVFIALCVLFLAVAVWRLDVAALIVLAELAIGSKGYLFAIEVGSFPVSIRLALFLLLFAASAVWMVREKQIRFFQWHMWQWTVALVAVLGLGVVTGYLYDNTLSNIFLDLNGYLFLGLAIPLTQAFYTREHVHTIIGVLLAAGVVVALKTVFLLVLFSQTLGFDPTLAATYKWVRDTGVGEITASVDGFPRIFFQSHVFLMYLFFVAGTYLFFSTETIKQFFKNRANASVWIFTALSILVIFLGGSRSMWVAFVAGGGLLVLTVLIAKRATFSRVLTVVGILAILAVGDFAIAYGLINMPLGGGSVSSSAILTQRTSDDNAGAAVASRKLLLVPLAEKAKERPVLGSGLGTTVTYHSEDPRAKEAFPEGYTTYAFEWGYLDLVTKFGLLGFLVFIGYFFVFARTELRDKFQSTTPAQLGLIFSIVALYATHFFTPYLNHPLGIGWLLVAGIALPLLGSKKGSDTKTNKTKA